MNTWLETIAPTARLAQELAKREQSPEMKAALDRFNRLIEDIAEKKLDRNEALRKM